MTTSKFTIISDKHGIFDVDTSAVVIVCVGGTLVCGVSAEYANKKDAIRIRKLQSDIQTIADEEFMTINGIAYTTWIIEKISNRGSGERLKLTIEFRLQQQGVALATVRSVREPIDWRSIRLESPAETSVASVLLPDLEQVTISLDNEQCSQYPIAPATPPPPSYRKVIDSFSKGIFSDCPKCSNQNSVFNAKYCTQCGYC
ncbi:unnamed protein product [Rotaria sordida]|uniref:Uncharacterized protein n=1 Tax=Rotaria sordida TaxID=392033 RepID=A0A814L7P2_9BILA|nr:unnamed protein product [Rotaria sordida]